MSNEPDPLWDPKLPGDQLTQALERLLKPLRSISEFKAEHTLTIQNIVVPSKAKINLQSRLRWLSLAAGLLVAMLFLGHQYRLSWPENLGWASTLNDLSGAEKIGQPLQPGQQLRTEANQKSVLAVARIGTIALGPLSKLTLLETKAGRHRVVLSYGRMRAKIWAPPGYFGVLVDGTEILDLGCEFELWKLPDGTSGLQVHSGWIKASQHDQEILIPEGHRLTLDPLMVSTPVRVNASTEFLRRLHTLDALLSLESANSNSAKLASRALADAAGPADQFTLLSLLTRFPALADSALYPKLAGFLGQSPYSEEHQRAWQAGDQIAINSWWAKLPNQPKQWWRYWADVW